ncbi:protein SIEVE ELEMENT OCCLUSION B-like [Gastrolobium bilobum]|uniref:protein SIEVE ELEMENT OCCLUSION B-like n=1 Tax=Gastrolobium bilobum TaxID=150636 RepID=UPI002AB05B9E|nr:protein SIEVE ELEMENT OCCLUSION B-like [Gastrolobium bilobum]
MSLSSAASATSLIKQGGTSLIQQTATLPQQKVYLPNPFDLNDLQILDKVYLTHVSDDETCDTKIIFDLVSNVILQSYSQIPITSFKPEFSTLKLISCQMIATRSAAHCAHQTTLWILQHLRSYSWDAKALITLAAFTLEYGNVLHLNRVPTTDLLGSSLKQLNQVQSRRVSTDVTELVTFIVQVFQDVKELATWSAEGYDPEDVPSLTEALQEIPVVVYWTIAAIVASTGNLFGVPEDRLSDYRDRLSDNVRKLKVHLKKCKEQIGYVDDYWIRMKIFDKPKDIVDCLKALIYRDGTQNPRIYEGTNQVKTGIEVFRQKHVLVFISSLDSIDDEILLLNSIYDRLQEEPKTMKGLKKEDFKILWIPIVDDWDDALKDKFKALRSKIKWYSVEDFFKLPGPGRRIITDPDRLHYRDNKPIIPVFNPQGTIINENAMELIFEWGIDAFPFRKSDGDDLKLKWKWLWDVLKKAIPGLEEKGDRYIFIYGGANNKWIQDFTLEMEKIKRNENIKRADVIIEHYLLGKDDPNRVPSFWIGIERKKQNKKHREEVDCEIQRIVKSLFCLKRDPQGWAILSKGGNIKILGHAEPMYQTVAEFQNWKEKVLVKEGFDIAFKEYYDAKVKEISASQPCAIINVDSYSANVIATITCPNPTCGRVMEVTSVNYKCCHGDAPISGKI